MGGLLGRFLTVYNCLPPVSFTPSTTTVEKFATSVVDTGGKFATGVVETGGNFAAGVVDTVGKFVTGFVVHSNKYCLYACLSRFSGNPALNYQYRVIQ